MKIQADTLIAVVIGGLFLALYALTLPGNHADAENAYHYAWQVEQPADPGALHHDHLLYIPLAKAAQRGLHAIGIPARGYTVLVGLSMLAGALSVALAFLILRQRLAFGREVALFAAGLIGISYGFWRYACEADLLIVAAAPLLLAI